MLTNTAEQRALQKAAARAALDNCKAMLAHDMEHLRAGIWNRVDERHRMAICNAASLPKDKGKGPLAQLSSGERAAIFAQARRVMREMENLMRCCQGGKTQDHGEMAGHAKNGIAAGLAAVVQ